MLMEHSVMGFAQAIFPFLVLPSFLRPSIPLSSLLPPPSLLPPLPPSPPVVPEWVTALAFGLVSVATVVLAYTPFSEDSLL